MQKLTAAEDDRWKDKTLITISENCVKMYRCSILGEHILLVTEPESKLLGYIAPAFGPCKCIQEPIIDFFLVSKISMESFVEVGCNGTNLNLGKYGDVVRLLEKKVK
ncbi:hypothetical protein AVEN_233852-1 [Araneus ventricosus]|uniref:Uncharacterized protein n=1 Tax=Araneus ventricosus TaxID=182803 RepID=A0A4Y2TZ88_ARAVE|nr:hypothetical protein AVEN_37213-1 [Araneus ventricosus]GBO05503.1 hypothetical protein AVEN_50768-1 [Araneus ventricosus]GBO05507.1 hypothetical protein AVEN_67732-1 [Araneus ventricosus]GBO05592.1 hypothetical protein AVEN_233852-1 [Araneus ventricosus]